MIPPPTNTLLDLRPDVGQVGYRFEFDVLSGDLAPLGRLDGAIATSIANDTTATIKRVLRGFTLKSSESREVNPYTDRIRATMVLEDGTRWPMGVFMFTEDVIRLQSSNHFVDTTLVDLSLRLNNEIRYPITIPQNGDPQPTYIKLLERFGIFDYDVQLPPTRIGIASGWLSGTRGLEILNQITDLCGAASPYFDNTGKHVARAHLPMTEDVAHVYRPGTHSRIIPNTLQVRRNLLTAPNVYVVESNALNRAPVVGTAFIDPRLPHSVERIGYERPKVIKMQALLDSDHATRLAAIFAATDPVQLEQSQFSSSIDPRHDTHEIVSADSSLYREVSWELPCQVGGQMTHTCAKSVDASKTTGAR